MLLSPAGYSGPDFFICAVRTQKVAQPRFHKALEMRRDRSRAAQSRGLLEQSQLRNPELCQHGDTTGTVPTRQPELMTARPPLGLTVATDRGRSSHYCSITRTRSQSHAGPLLKDPSSLPFRVKTKVANPPNVTEA